MLFLKSRKGNILDWLLVNELHGFNQTSLLKRSHLAFTPGLWLYPCHALQGKSTWASFNITNTDSSARLASAAAAQDGLLTPRCKCALRLPLVKHSTDLD